MITKLLKRTMLVGLLASISLPQVLTCQTPGVDGVYYQDYYEEVWYEETYYEDYYYDDGWSFDFWLW
ncbi:MAG: hypothetical protein ABIG44_07490 [Planctomycetota bacterium]